jgi:molybdopterin molybdotransferase
MGAYDTVKAVLSQLGSVDFMKVAMNPGMPQGHGHVGQDRAPIITLPGNPVSSYISFENFVRPAIRRMRGLTELHRPRLRLRAAVELASPSAKRQYARAVILPSGEVAPVGAGQGSHVLGGLAVADALIVVPEDVTVVQVGDEVEVVDLRGQ